MWRRGIVEWVSQSRNKDILLAFSVPNTPAKVERKLSIKKLKLGPFLDKKLLESLNPDARKGRLYMLTFKARKLLELPQVKKDSDKNWDLTGWIMSSPKQRLIVLNVMDDRKMTSEEIREKAYQLNPCLSRTSTKDILKELISKGLVETEINDRKRIYWLNGLGIHMKHQVGVIDSFSHLFLPT